MDENSKKYLEEELAKIDGEIANLSSLLTSELATEAQEEVKRLTEQRDQLVKALEGDVDDGDEEENEPSSFNSVILEARPGVGGEEAKIWADDLVRMYMRYFETVKNKVEKKYKVEVLDDSVIKIKGPGVYDLLKWETGVHRVQRVPDTEAQGRIHTSTASIVVLPEVAEKVIEIKEDDLLWEFTRGGGHGGQNVNKVATAVRLTHRPTGLVVQARQERFQEQNRKIALSLLRSQLWEIEQEKKLSVVAGQRAAIGRSMRAEKIRTYNYPQNRVTDHRVGKSWHKLDKIVEGDLGDVVTALSESGGGILPQQ